MAQGYRSKLPRQLQRAASKREPCTSTPETGRPPVPGCSVPSGRGQNADGSLPTTPFLPREHHLKIKITAALAKKRSPDFTTFGWWVQGPPEPVTLAAQWFPECSPHGSASLCCPLLAYQSYDDTLDVGCRILLFNLNYYKLGFTIQKLRAFLFSLHS